MKEQLPAYRRRAAAAVSHAPIGNRSFRAPGSIAYLGNRGVGGLAEFERGLIRALTGEGRARANVRGKSLGRPFKMTTHQRQEALARRERGELLTEIARSYNISAATISRLTV